MKVNVNFRLDSRDKKKLEAIALGKSLSDVLREAVKEYLAAYTGEATLQGLQRRVQEIDRRLRRVEDALIEAGGETLNVRPQHQHRGKANTQTRNITRFYEG